MGKRDGVDTHRTALLSHKEGDITPRAATRKEAETITLSEVSKPREDKSHMIALGGGV